MKESDEEDAAADREEGQMLARQPASRKKVQSMQAPGYFGLLISHSQQFHGINHSWQSKVNQCTSYDF